MPKLAVLQMPISANPEDNLSRSCAYIEEAAAQGAHIVLLPELFETHYFCQLERESFFSWAHTDPHAFLERFQRLAQRHRLVLPISFFEKAGPVYFNSVAMIDATGDILGMYRKSHIPDGPGYEEKFYFSPGNTGFKTWKTVYGSIGVGICWDQWFPEAARIMTLLGADLLLYPTAIGSEPLEVESPNSHEMWQRAMVGHAVCNSIYVAAANRLGTESLEHNSGQSYYGQSFVSDYTGAFLAESHGHEGLVYAELDFARAQTHRAAMGFFRDRRPDLYGALLTTDGTH